MSDKSRVTIYTRGIALPRGEGYGVLLLCEGRRKELSGGEVGASNNRMDLASAEEGLRALKFPCRVSLYNTNSTARQVHEVIEGRAEQTAAADRPRD
jgi:ribonuclease HI